MEDVDDIVLGCAFPESDQGLNLGRVVAMRAGFPIRSQDRRESVLFLRAEPLRRLLMSHGGSTEVMICRGVEL